LSLINWNKPEKVNKGGSFDGGPPGGYVPQMSDGDAQQWRGKHINKGKSGERIELRRTFKGPGHYSQVLIVVDSSNVVMSSNGKIQMSHSNFVEFAATVMEANRMLTTTSG